jgi:hypothetical protein
MIKSNLFIIDNIVSQFFGKSNRKNDTACSKCSEAIGLTKKIPAEKPLEILLLPPYFTLLCISENVA